ncbi:MAG: hypothetical protein HY271_12290 [Deltaproteobacteria bacterium]|nr:hypothetical protein [Deltaproteobacteria bacterium]
MTLPTWMRGALFATAAMNLMAAVGFLPTARALRAVAGMPEGEHPLYLATVSMFVLLFGLGYLWTAATGRADRLFIAIAAVGKLSFFGLLVWFWAAGALPFRAPLAGSGDLVFGLLFAKWLFTPRAIASARSST